MLRSFCVFTIVTFGLLGPLAVAQEAQVPCSVKVTTDREDAIYEVGEKATFNMTVWQGKELVSGEGELTFVVDDFLSSKLFPNGKVTPDDEPTQDL